MRVNLLLQTKWLQFWVVMNKTFIRMSSIFLQLSNFLGTIASSVISFSILFRFCFFLFSSIFHWANYYPLRQITFLYFLFLSFCLHKENLNFTEPLKTNRRMSFFHHIVSGIIWGQFSCYIISVHTQNFWFPMPKRTCPVLALYK